MDVYYDPKEAGLEIVAEIEDSDDYDFHKLVVWKNKNDELFYGEDSGCSCPSPFEDFHSEADLTRITLHEFDSFERIANGMDCPATEIMEFIKKIKDLL